MLMMASFGRFFNRPSYIYILFVLYFFFFLNFVVVDNKTMIKYVKILDLKIFLFVWRFDLQILYALKNQF